MPGVSAFVVLALVLAVMSIATIVVVTRELLRNVRRLNATVKATNQRLLPLTDELQAELAVTTVEVEGLNRSMQRLQKARSTPPVRTRSRRSRRRR
jgi:predicted PurR-regulated permease PerM